MSEEEKTEKEEKLEESQKATGIKTEAKNISAINEAKDKEEVDGGMDFPSLFIEEDNKIRIDVNIMFDPQTGRPLLIMAAKDNDTELKYLKKVHVWAEFSHPSYTEVSAYRQQAMTWNKETNQHLTDPIQLRMLYIRYHLKEWSVMDKDGKVIELEEKNGILTNECMKKVSKVNPALMDVFMTEFERETLLG